MSQEFTYKDQCYQYGIFEVSLHGPQDGNPFLEQSVQGIFSNAQESVTTEGFYDGNGIYKIRFMPQYTGMYHFVLRASFVNTPVSGKFYVNPHKQNNHGVVHVHDTYHFMYTDGTPYVSVGTTCYVWHLQEQKMLEQTIASLQESGFNKIRFCVFPKHYNYNFQDPDQFPYEGEPMDASVLTEDNFMDYMWKKEGNNWDFTRFNPVYFQRLEACLSALQHIGVQADLILMHPYDRWGFSDMGREADDLYYHYVINRLSSFSNVWWSLANEYDLMPWKTMEDWDRYGQMLVKYDPYHHLRSIHNCRLVFDHTKPWITHVSYQRVDLYKGAELTDSLRTQYGKPVVMDEIGYEGDIQFGWGDLTPQEMLRRFWETAIRGGYPGHGETYLAADNKLWWSHGGTLKGESWKRFALLKEVMSAFPQGEIAPFMNEWDSVSGVPEVEWTSPVKSMYVYYYSFMRPSFREFYFDEETHFKVEVIDTWDATVKVAGVFCGKFKVELPAKQYMAIRLTKTDEILWVAAKEEEELPKEKPFAPSVFAQEQEPEVVSEEPVEEVPETDQEPIVEEEEASVELVEPVEEPAAEEEPILEETAEEEFQPEEEEPVEEMDVELEEPVEEEESDEIEDSKETEEEAEFEDMQAYLDEVKQKSTVVNLHDTSTIMAILDDLDELEDTAELTDLDETDDGLDIFRTKR